MYWSSLAWIGPVEATASPCGARTSNLAVGSSACADAESADENFKRPQVRAFFCILTQFVREPFRSKVYKISQLHFFLSLTADIKSDGFRLTRALMGL